MSSLPWYRDREQLTAAIEEHGSPAEAARALGAAPRTVGDWAKKFGLSVNHRPGKVVAPGSKVSREELLEAENKELKATLRQYRSSEVQDEKLLEAIREGISPITPRYKPAPLDRKKKRTSHTFFLQWSDLHASEVVAPDQINGLNAFDWEIMLARHERMRHALLSFKEHRPYQVEELVIGAIGDMLTGDIHDELRVTNEKVLVEATFQLAQDMGDWIETLVPEFPKIRIRCTFGNHGRTTQKPSFKNAFSNWDWLFYKTLQLRLSNYKSIDFEVTKAAQVPVLIYDKRVLLWHGDGPRTTMVDVPWGGIMRFCKKLSDTWRMQGQPIDHFAIGHWHEPNQIRAGWILMNGSIKGVDEYSLARFGGGHHAAQCLNVFHPQRGLTETCLLDLQKG